MFYLVSFTASLNLLYRQRELVEIFLLYIKTKLFNSSELYLFSDNIKALGKKRRKIRLNSVVDCKYSFCYSRLNSLRFLFIPIFKKKFHRRFFLYQNIFSSFFVNGIKFRIDLIFIRDLNRFLVTGVNIAMFWNYENKKKKMISFFLSCNSEWMLWRNRWYLNDKKKPGVES